MIVLASASPRRRSLLAETGLELRVEPAAVDETLQEGTAPQSGAAELAERKARAVAPGVPPGTPVLGADTIVALPAGGGFRLLGKPDGPEEAAGMLRALSGSRHLVVTGVSVVVAPRGPVRSAWEGTFVTMRSLTDGEITAYVETGEWRDKAGGYAIQENADAFVSRLEGGFDTVVGLPVRLALQLLARAGSSEAARALVRLPRRG